MATPSQNSTTPGPVAYLTGEYPKVSHTFIQREIAALRRLGMQIAPCTIRRADSKDVGADQQDEAKGTFAVLETAKSPKALMGAHLAQLRTAPSRWFSALRLAWRTRPPGAKALAWQMFYFAEAAVLAQHLRQIGARHLHNHFANSSCSVAMLTAEMTGLPFSFTLHGPSELFEPALWRLDEKIARAAFTVHISHFARSQAMLFSDQAHWPRMRIVHCGIDPDLYGRDETSEGAGRIAFVGRLTAVKGAVLLLDAFARLRGTHPGATLTLVGDGPDRAQLEARTDKLGLRDAVQFTGYLGQAEVAGILARADMLVLPSFAEGVPVVLMEAMASNIPVIASRVAGVQELVEDGVSGFAIPPGDLDMLTARIDTLLSDPARRQRMGQAGRATVVKDFDINAEAAWLKRLFEGSLAGHLPDTLRPSSEIQIT